MRGIRTAGAVVAGVFGAGLVIAAVESVAHRLAGADTAFLGAVFGYGLGAAVGTAIASRIGAGRFSALVPVVLVVLAVINLLSFPHPLWFVPAAALSLALGWFAGARLGAVRR